MHEIVCDASSLISLSDNCLLWILNELEASFLVPHSVKLEIVDYPLQSKRFELKALRLNEAITDGVLKVIHEPRVRNRANEILRLANSVFKYGGHTVKIIHKGEAETIALMKEKGYQTLLIDERTTRLLIEDIYALKKYIESRTGFRIKMNREIVKDLQKKLRDIRVVRSGDLVAYAYEQGLLDRYGTKEALKATLYGVKYAGCAITNEEIEQYVKMLT
ncbi:MAG: hypothetical protein J7K68_00460 [Candidatus Diapherotrites archaeon]|nr:hypothetical protein [Candidatus Diapherotrites archaeon]